MKIVWGFKNSEINLISEQEYFTPLNEEQSNRLVEIWSEEKLFILGEEISIYGDYQNGFITLEEKEEKIKNLLYSAFLTTQERFKVEFGVTPVKGIIE